MRARTSNISGVVAGVAMSLSLLPLETMAQQSYQVQKITLPSVVTKPAGGFINDSGQMAIPYYDGAQFVYKLSFIDRGVFTPVTGMRIREFNNLGKMSGFCDTSGACVWGKATGYTTMGNVTLPNGSIGVPDEATGLNNQNQVAGTGWVSVGSTGHPFAFTWNATTGTRFIDYGYGYAIADDSTVQYDRVVPGVLGGEHRLWRTA